MKLKYVFALIQLGALTALLFFLFNQLSPNGKKVLTDMGGWAFNRLFHNPVIAAVVGFLVLTLVMKLIMDIRQGENNEE